MKRTPARYIAVPRSPFHQGDRVRMTREAMGFFPGMTTGTVASTRHDRRYVNVLRDGHRKATLYAVEFWRREHKQGSGGN